MPLAVAAIVLLVWGAALSAPASTAMIGAGSALAGAAATRIIDLDRERRTEAAQAEASHRRDLDETRRLAYMALAVRGTKRYELTATIVNALAHHSLAVDPEVATAHVQNLVNDMPINRDQSRRWLQELIDQITAELGS
jgi:hypothetical protein